MTHTDVSVPCKDNDGFNLRAKFGSGSAVTEDTYDPPGDASGKNCCIGIKNEDIPSFRYKGCVDLTGVQLILGDASRRFEETDTLEELNKCQRYYEKGRVFVAGLAYTEADASDPGTDHIVQYDYVVDDDIYEVQC